MHEDDVLGKAYDARLMRRLLRVPAAVLAQRPAWRSSRSSRRSALQLVPPWLTRQVIDVYIPARDL